MRTLRYRLSIESGTRYAATEDAKTTGNEGKKAYAHAQGSPNCVGRTSQDGIDVVAAGMALEEPQDAILVEEAAGLLAIFCPLTPFAFSHLKSTSVNS